MSGGSLGVGVGHVTPEAAVGGPIALIEDGDPITIDASANRIDLGISKVDLESRRAEWKRPPSNVKTGILAKYRAEVRSASDGSITVAPPWDE